MDQLGAIANGLRRAVSSDDAGFGPNQKGIPDQISIRAYSRIPSFGCYLLVVTTSSHSFPHPTTRFPLLSCPATRVPWIQPEGVRRGTAPGRVANRGRPSHHHDEASASDVAVLQRGVRARSHPVSEPVHDDQGYGRGDSLQAGHRLQRDVRAVRGLHRGEHH